MLICLFHWCYFPSERLIYIEGRLLFDFMLWAIFALRHFSLAIFLSLLYSFAKEKAFEDPVTFDELYVLILIFVPFVYLAGLLFSFTLFYAIFYIYSLLMLMIGVIIFAIVIIKLVNYWGNHQNEDSVYMIYKRSIFATCFGCTFIIVFYECVFSYIKADSPSSNDINHEYRLMVNNEILIMAAFTFLLRLFDKEDVSQHYLEGDNEIVEVNDPQNEQVQGYRFFRTRGRWQRLNFPLPVQFYEEEEKVMKSYFKKLKRNKRKGKGKSFKKLEDSKELNENSLVNTSIETSIFARYNSDVGFISTKWIDFRSRDNDGENSVESSVSSQALSLDKIVPQDLFFDAYNGTNCIYIPDASKIKLPVCIVNPEYFTEHVKNQKERNQAKKLKYKSKDINYHDISILS